MNSVSYPLKMVSQRRNAFQNYVKPESLKNTKLRRVLIPSAWSRGVPGPEGSALAGGGVPGPGGVGIPAPLRQTPPGETATAADGTHPTGMHSCF